MDKQIHDLRLRLLLAMRSRATTLIFKAMAAGQLAMTLVAQRMANAKKDMP